MDDLDDFDEDEGSLRRHNLLYLLAELERALERGGIEWTAEDVGRLPDRVARLMAALRHELGAAAPSASGPTSSPESAVSLPVP